jgi:hypothetical protein
MEATNRQTDDEVLRNRDILDDKESRVPSDREISDLESQAAALRSQLAALDAANAPYEARISELQRTRDALRQQTEQLNRLTKYFLSVTPSGDAPELPPDVRAAVLRKVDEIVDVISHRFDPLDESEFPKFLTDFQQLEAAIDSEIEILSEIASDDWHPPKDLQSSLDEYCARFPVRAATTTLSAVDVPHATRLLEVFKRPFQADLPAAPPAEGFSAQLSDLSGSLADRRHREEKIYEEQLRFLQKLNDAACRRADAPKDDPMDLVGDVGEIEPLSIPPPSLSSDADPLAVLRETLGDLVAKLKGSRESLRLVEDFEACMSGALSIPEFQPPPKPKVVRNPVPSQQLDELANVLARFRDGASRLIPADALQSLVQSQRLPVSAPAREPSPVPRMPLPPLFEVSDDQTGAALSDFRASVAAKLPPALARQLQASQRIAQIEDDDVDDDDGSSAEAPFECGVEERTLALNVILQSMASVAAAPVPVLVEPQIRLTPDLADTARLLDAVDKLLASEQ